MRFLIDNRYGSLWLVSAICFGVSFIHPGLWFGAILGFVPMLLAICKTTSFRGLVQGSLVVGIGKAAGGMVGLWYAYPLTPLGLGEGVNEWLVFFSVWSFGVLAVAIGVLLSAVVQYWLFKDHGIRTLIAFPVLWVAGELLGSLMLSLLFLGPGAVPNINFSFGYTGLAVAHLALLYPVALIAGVYGLSFTAAAIGLLVFTISVTNKDRWAYTLKAGVGAGAFFMVAYNFFPSPEIIPLDTKVVAVETNFSTQLLKLDNGYDIKYEQVLASVLSAAKLKPDIILLPEDSRLTSIFDSPNEALSFLASHITDPVVIVDSSRVTDTRGNTVERAFYYDLGNNEVYQTDKQYLVPQGEFVPYAISWLLSFTGRDELLAQLDHNQNYRPGELVGYEQFPEALPGIMFCSESLIPFGIKLLAKERSSELVLHPISHAWFDEHHPIMQNQLDSMLRVQAIWSGKTIISATNMSEGKAYYPNGVIGRGMLLSGTPLWQLVEYDL